MRDSSSKDLSVYDFGAEDLGVEAASAKFLKKSAKPWANPKEKKGDRLTKNDFFKAFSGLKQVDVIDIPYIDLSEHSSSKVPFSKASSDRNNSSKEKSGLDEIMASSTSYDGKDKLCLGECDHESLARVDLLVPGASAGYVAPSADEKHESELHSDGSPVDVISDDEGSYTSLNKPPSASASDLEADEDYLECPVSNNCCAEYGKEDKDELEVTVQPDYFSYGETLYDEVLLIFTPDLLVVEHSDSCRNSENFLLKCAVADIIYIECQGIGNVEATLVKFVLRATTVKGNDKVCNTCDSGQLEFVVSGRHWLEKEQKIKSLATRYQEAWNVLQYDDLIVEEGAVQRDNVFPKHYFIEIPESFEDVVYPKGDPDAVSISRRDIELLQPDTFINDTIVDFYIKYLKGRIPPNEKHRYHFFNSFFFRKLADLDKDPGSASEGRAAFLRVRKWTRKVDIFEKDYIFVPVNFNLHWSLLVICHPGEASSYEESDVKDTAKVPCVLHMDSIKGSHSGLKNLVQCYLWEEWKERHPEEPEENSSKFSNLRFVSLELPQQENSSDCGLFLLHYVELFLEEAPVNFNPFKITMFSNFLNVDWFSPSEASFKRSVIRKLIYDILNDPSQKVNPRTFCDGNISLGYSQNVVEQEHAVNYLSEQYSTSGTVVGNSVCFVTEGEPQMNHLATPSHNISQCDKQEGLLLGEFLGTKATSISSTKRQDQSFQDNAPSQILKYPTCPTKDEQFVSSTLDKYSSRPSGGSPTTQTCSTSYYTKNGVFDMPWNCLHEKETGIELLPEALDSDHLVSSQRGGIEKPRSVLMEDRGYVPDSPTSSAGENEDDDSQDDSMSRKDDSRYCGNSYKIEVMTKATSGAIVGCVQDSQETTSSKAVEDEVIRNSQGFGYTDEAKSENGEECQEHITNEVKVGGAEDSQQNGSGKAEEGQTIEKSHQIGDVVEAESCKCEECELILATDDKVVNSEVYETAKISEVNGVTSEDCQVVGHGMMDAVDGEDCKVIDPMERKDEEHTKCRQICSNSVPEKGGSSEEPLRLTSCHELSTASVESSENVSLKHNREKTVVLESVLRYHKRRKVLPSGIRRNTRSQTRDWPS